jgi:predicted RNA-binding Zn-ribbon protein involved in translation (DUF1610 family)
VAGRGDEVKKATITQEMSTGRQTLDDEWFRCPNCGEDDITRRFDYCPNCGAQLDHEITEPYEGPKLCPVCKRVLTVKQDGTMITHGYGMRGGVMRAPGSVCPGSGKPWVKP